MVRKVDITVLDDLTGEPAATTIVFGVRGAWYEIDLTADNATYVTSLLDRWSTAGRRRTPLVDGARTTADRARTAAIRAWAADHDMAISSKGRLPVGVVHAYHAAVTDRGASAEYDGASTDTAVTEAAREDTTNRPDGTKQPGQRGGSRRG